VRELVLLLMCYLFTGTQVHCCGNLDGNAYYHYDLTYYNPYGKSTYDNVRQHTTTYNNLQQQPELL